MSSDIKLNTNDMDLIENKNIDDKSNNSESNESDSDSVMDYLEDTIDIDNKSEIELEKNTNIILGIDLGTTNSCISIWRNNNVEIIPDEYGNKTVPSYCAHSRFSNDSTWNMVKNLSKSQIRTWSCFMDGTFITVSCLCWNIRSSLQFNCSRC